MEAMSNHVSDEAIEASRSLASRLQRLSQASVRSTTQRRATRTKPFAPSGHLTILTTGPFIFARAATSFSPA